MIQMIPKLNAIKCYVFLLFLLNINSIKAQTPFSGTRSVGLGGYYSNLTAAVADVLFNGVNGPVILELNAGYSSAAEAFPISIGSISGSSAANTIIIRPNSSAAYLSINGSNTSSLIDFNGAQFVSIDGRPGGTGSYSSTCLSIINNSGTAPTIRLQNEARYNTVRFCDLQSNNSTITTAISGGGVVCIGSTNGLNGNDFNSINNCDIHNAPGGNPVMGVFAYGSSTTAASNNDSNTVSNCNIYNFFNASIATSGINIATGNNGWYILNNKFYQTSALIYNGAVIHRAINISAGSGYSVNNNFIGGNNSSGTGLYAMAGPSSPTTSTHVFIAIEATFGTLATSNVNNNTITNIDFTSAFAGSLSMGGINILGGNVICNYNTIGTPGITGALKVTTNCTTNVGGLICLRSGTSVNNITFNYNTISGIEMYGNATTYTPEFHGINITQTTTTAVANNNIIGSLTVPNSINLVSTCATSTYAQRLDGFIINNTTASSVTINNNIVANLNTNYMATGAQASAIRGIYILPTSTGTYAASNNIVRNLTSATQTTGGGINCGIVGIGVSTTTANVNLIGNQIHSLALTGASTTAAVQCEGIFYSGMSSGTNLINKNSIHSLSINALNTSAYLTAIDAGAGLLTLSNNMIRLGFDSLGTSITTPCFIRGISKNVSVVTMYFNSIYIGGSNVGTSSSNTFAFQRTATAADIIKNNIFVNNRSNSSTGGKHYQFFLINNTTYTTSNNIYFGNGTGAVFATINNGTSDILSFTSNWVSGDASSISSDPQFMNATGSAAFGDLHISNTNPTVVEQGGIAITGFTDDFDGDLRASYTATDIGADAGNFIVNDIMPPTISIPSLLGNTVSTSDRTFSATITDVTGVFRTATYRPRIYFRKSSSSSYASNQGVFLSGSSQSGTWSFTISGAALGGISAGDSIYYYLVAQDSATINNIGFLPLGGLAFDVNSISVNPASPYGYKISSAISGGYTVGLGGTYPTLTNAFADINSNIVTGPITLELLSSYSSASETFPISITRLNGVTNTNNITIRPIAGATGLKITSAAAATIEFNGAQYITFDGRVGGFGSRDLAIINTSLTGVAVRFINDACFNQLIHDSLVGVNSASAGGVVFFSTTTGARGNDSNVVDNCDIKDGATTPATAIYSSGTTTTTAQFNSNNAITNCNIYNFWNPTTECNAFKIASGNTDWIMSGNSMYQTATRTATAAFQQYLWNLNNASANNHIITNNYIGGSAPLCGGAPWVATSTVGFRITGSYLNVGSTIPSTFSGNTFANINLTSGGTAYATIPGVFSGAWIVGGLINVNNNTFGSMTSTNSIVINSNINNNSVIPIGATRTTAGTINIKNNRMGGITVAGTSAAISSNLLAISLSTSTATATYNVDSNIIGNSLPDNMIASSASTSATGQQMAGIYSSNASFLNIRYNTIQNFRNNTIGTSTTPTNWAHAIDISGNSVDSIIGNTLANFTIAAAFQNNNSGSAALVGIRAVPATAANFISRNTIYGFTLSNAGAATVTINGIVTNNMLAPSILQNNYIHGFNVYSSAATSSLFGISQQGGTAKYINNMVNLGIDSTGNSLTTTPLIYGIYKLAGSINLFFNSIYIGGTSVGTGTGNTFCYNSAAAGVDSVLNNVFSNERSNASTGGTHYAIFLTSNTTLNCNSNIYYTSGTGGMLGNFGTSPASTMGSWSGLTGLDGGSGFANPQFANPLAGNTSLDMHISSFIGSPVERGGVLISYITTDFDGQNRSSLTPTDIGADAGNFILSDISAPSIVHSPLANTALTTDRTFFANIVDGTGLKLNGTTKPRVYYKKSAAGFYYSTAANFVSGTPQNGLWSFVISSSTLGSLSLGDSVYYYIIAQDSSALNNLSSLPAGVQAFDVNTVSVHPISNFAYTIVPGLNGILTVGSGGTYPSLTMAGGAFAAINAASLTGNIELSIISDLVEDGTNTLNQWNESGVGNYTVAIKPNTNTLRSIAGIAAANAGLITLNGADRVLIDGRYAGSGMYLSFRNRSTGGSTIKLLNDAHCDTIKYAYIEGLSNTSPGATIWFNTPSTTGTGNDSNAIMYCVIKDTLNNTTAGNVQNTAFYSNGNYNSENSFSYNQIYNYLYQGVNIGSGLLNHDNWVCNNNAFFQGDNARTKTSSSASQAFYIYSGNNWTINNNSIGGSAPDRSGTAFKATWNTTLNIVFKPIEISVGTNIASTISGNTISNIQTNPLLSTTAAFSGIYMVAGLCTITNNIIGGGVNAYDTIVEGSYNGAAINIIGGVATISNNTISNLYNYSVYSAAKTNTIGILIAGGSANISGNSIHDIKSINAAFGTAPAFANSSPTGIYVGTASTNLVNIDGNTIYNLSCISTVASATNATGISIFGGTCTLQRNRIYNIFTLGTGAGIASPYVCGIFLNTSGNLIKNNQISLGYNAGGESQIFGIQDLSATGTNNIYYNSIFINGRTTNGSNNSYCIQRASASNTPVWNNVLYNNRTSAGTGFNFAFGSSNISGINSASINYNLLVVADTSKILEYPAGVNTGLSAFNSIYNPSTYNTNWIERTVQITPQSIFTDTAIGNLSTVTNNANCWYMNGKGIALSGISGDFNNATTIRSTSISAGATDIGSTEFTTGTAPFIATAFGTPALNSTTLYKVANRVVASVSWGATGVVPLSANVSYYSGLNAPNLLASKTQFNAYVSLAAIGAIGLNYQISILADSACFGNVSGSNSAKLATYIPSIWSLKSASACNPSNGLLATTASLTNGNLSAVYTGTDIINPLPLEWLSFNALQINSSVTINWSTAWEQNTSRFILEKSIDGKHFSEIATFAAAGNTYHVSNYNFIDQKAFVDNTNALYYQLKEIDRDGRINYSKIEVVRIESLPAGGLNIYPNPFTNKVYAEWISTIEEPILIEVYDLSGKLISAIEKTSIIGENKFELSANTILENGFYQVLIKTSGNTFTAKLLKSN